jgi:hypothetical protein
MGYQHQTDVAHTPVISGAKQSRPGQSKAEQTAMKRAGEPQKGTQGGGKSTGESHETHQTHTCAWAIILEASQTGPQPVHLPVDSSVKRAQQIQFDSCPHCMMVMMGCRACSSSSSSRHSCNHSTTHESHVMVLVVVLKHQHHHNHYHCFLLPLPCICRITQPTFLL